MLHLLFLSSVYRSVFQFVCSSSHQNQLKYRAASTAIRRPAGYCAGGHKFTVQHLFRKNRKLESTYHFPSHFQSHFPYCSSSDSDRSRVHTESFVDPASNQLQGTTYRSYTTIFLTYVVVTSCYFFSSRETQIHKHKSK